MQISLRPATDDDYDFLWRLHCAAMRPYVEKTWGWDKQWQAEYFHNHFDPTTRQIIEGDGGPIGCILVERREDRIFLAAIEIAPDYQGRDIGTELIQSLCSESDGRGVPVELQVLKVNPARCLYERLGFAVVGETQTHSSERRTRENLIDPALKKAGWDVSNPDQVGIEIPVDEFDPQAWRALEARLRRLRETGVVYEVELPKGVSDYVLYRPDGDIIAVVEAKRTSIDPRLAQAQTEFYLREIAKRQDFAPFAFMTNGYRIEFWDVGHANPRQVAGFFSPADLDNLFYIRQNQTPLAAAPINLEITDRPYQLEAMQRLCDAFENKKKRKALLVMATGTGKTRVAMSLADVFMRTNQARKILFVADRDALVRQALAEGFEDFLPDEPCARILSHNTHRVKAKRSRCIIDKVSVRHLQNV
jgi:GNAT superfamily N-acetyltransferase